MIDDHPAEYLIVWHDPKRDQDIPIWELSTFLTLEQAERHLRENFISKVLHQHRIERVQFVTAMTFDDEGNPKTP